MNQAMDSRFRGNDGGASAGMTAGLPWERRRGFRGNDSGKEVVVEMPIRNRRGTSVPPPVRSVERDVCGSVQRDRQPAA